MNGSGSLNSLNLECKLISASCVYYSCATESVSEYSSQALLDLASWQVLAEIGARAV